MGALDFVAFGIANDLDVTAERMSRRTETKHKEEAESTSSAFR